MLHPLYNLIFEISLGFTSPPPQFYIMSKLLGKANSSKILLLEGPNFFSARYKILVIRRKFFLYNLKFGRLETDTIAFFLCIIIIEIYVKRPITY